MNSKDITHLKLMLDFARRAVRRVSGVTIDRFLADQDLQDMVLYAVGQVGENASAISDTTHEKYHELLWGPIIGIRNRVFHSYGDIDMSIVFEAITDHMPVLIEQIETILAKLGSNIP